MAMAAITGHATGQNVLEMFYIGRKSLLGRGATLAKLSVFAELLRYQPRQFDEYLRQAK